MPIFDSNLSRLRPPHCAVLLVAALSIGLGCGGTQSVGDTGPAPFGEEPIAVASSPREFTLAELRSAVPRAPVFDVEEPPRLPTLESLPNGWLTERYASEVGELLVYRNGGTAEAPEALVRVPVVVWAHAGVGGVVEETFRSRGSDEHPVMHFARAGFRVVVPTWRGEHDNPGRYESFYGEVNDLQAAVDYARQLPGVDPEYVFLAGHSEGGTLALLASVAGVDVAGVLVVGGAADICPVAMNGGYGYEPYRLDRSDQCIVRSANVFVSHIQSPTWYAEAAGGVYLDVAQAMDESARAIGVPFRAVGVTGVDHASAPAVVVPLFAAAIQRAFARQRPFVLVPSRLSNAPDTDVAP
ncbi:MAG: acetyl esterase/lipase [Bradymonadia bacterium]|jgi:acetyl esterase/lipase